MWQRNVSIVVSSFIKAWQSLKSVPCNTFKTSALIVCQIMLLDFAINVKKKHLCLARKFMAQPIYFFFHQIACRRPFQFVRTEWVNTLVTSVAKFLNIQVTKV